MAEYGLVLASNVAGSTFGDMDVFVNEGRNAANVLLLPGGTSSHDHYVAARLVTRSSCVRSQGRSAEPSLSSEVSGADMSVTIAAI